MDARLTALRRDPSPQFADTLRSRLRACDSSGRRPSPGQWLRTAVLPAVIAIMAALLLSVPAVRASAAAFLARFRVTSFVAVTVDPSRFETLGAKQLDLGRLIGEHTEVLEDGGQPVQVNTLDEASARAGFQVHTPGWMPEGAQIIEIDVRGRHVVRVTADTTRLQQVLDALGITDLDIPDGLDGQSVTIDVPPVVMIRYEHGGRRTRFYQSPSPEVTLPAGIDLAAIGEIGLRILGSSADQANRFAHAIDWTTTLVLPLPPDARGFHEVDIAGHPGMAMSFNPPDADRTNLVLWSTDDRVFGLMSIQELDQVMSMAYSVR